MSCRLTTSSRIPNRHGFHCIHLIFSSTQHISNALMHILPLDLFNNTITKLRQVVPCYVVVASKKSEIPVTGGIEVEDG